MPIKEGLRVLERVWGNKPSWVAVPAKQGKKWMERCFEWPKERKELIDWIKECIKERRDIYWCPTPLKLGKRVKQNISQVSVLYADLDQASVKDLPVTPSVLWESSPGRHQCLWLLRESLSPKDAERLNKSLSYASNADKGGWDLTQVLRIPGSVNYKYKPPARGCILQSPFTLHSPSTIQSSMTTSLTPNEENTDTLELDVDWDLTWKQVIKPYRDKISKKALELLRTQESDIEVGERSDKLWELGHLLLEAGISIEDVCAALADSPWNKFKGRADEKQRIMQGVVKASAETPDKSVSIDSFVERAVWVSYADLLADPDPRPGWLVEEIWQRDSHGMLAGEPKTYKSFLSTELAIAVASGRPFLGEYAVKATGPVLIIQEENAPWIVQDRLLKIATARGLNDTGCWPDLRGNLHVKLPEEQPIYFLNNLGFDLTVEEHKDFIERSVQRMKPLLVIFDPLYMMLGDKDEKDSKDIRPILLWLMQLRFNYNTSVLLVHHWNKSGKSERGGQRMLGSGLLHGWVESAMYAKIVDERAHKIAVEREFRAYPKRQDLQIQFELADPGELDYEVTVEEIAAGQSTVDLVELVRGTSGLTLTELQAQTGLARNTLKRRLDDAVVKGQLGRLGGGKGRGKTTIYMSTSTKEGPE